MSPSVTCYAQPDKAKSRRVLEAFAAGCGGRMASTRDEELRPAPAAFYGVRTGWARLWHQALDERRDWYYIDNAWFDSDRERCFRVARNCVQQTEFPPPARPASRKVAPWREDGDHIVVCPQSAEFLRVLFGIHEHWTERTCARLRRFTGRRLVIRRKGDRRSLQEDLRGAWACVVHTSCAAVEALLAGVPIFAGAQCSALVMASADLAQIESPRMPDGRERLIAQLEAAQWTLDEMRSGQCWADLQA